MSKIFSAFLFFVAFLILHVNAADSFGFADQNVEAATGLSDNRARAYDPETGTFLSKDPLGIAGSVNAYRYASDNPINLADPLGLDTLGESIGIPESVRKTMLGGAYLTFGAAITVGTLGAGYEVGAAAVAEGGGTLGGTLLYGAPVVATQAIGDPALASTGILAIGGTRIVVSNASNFFSSANVDISATSQIGGGLIPTLRGNIPVAEKWIINGGSVVYGDGTITYTKSNGDAVVYNSLGYPDFSPYLYTGTDGENTVRINLANPTDTIADIDAANAKAGFDSTPVGYTWHYNEDAGLMQLVDSTIHNTKLGGFPHSGGISVANDDGSLLIGPDAGLDFLSLDVGGVLINQAATLIGANLSDIKGASYDPITKQIIFLGSTTQPTATLPGINMDYFYTAVQAVYGSATPPFVTLNMPVNPFPTWVNYTTASDGTLLRPGQTGGFPLLYKPAWPQVDNNVAIRIRCHDANNVQYDFSYTLTAAYATAYHLPGSTTQSPMLLYYNPPTATSGSSVPSGLVFDTSAFSQTSLQMTPPQPTFAATQPNEYEEATYPVRIYNNGSTNMTIDTVMIIPDQQHRIFGGRVDGTRLGWVMYEADRIMKCLAIGKDDLTGTVYSSTQNTPVTGFKNVVELAAAHTSGNNFSRLWFEPNQMTLQSYTDPTSGRATVSFSTSTVQLLTEAQIAGQTPAPEDVDFVNFFNQNYDAFAAQNFTVVDPTDATGKGRLSVPIFSLLKQVMQAVSLARFFRDNNIPLDRWWMSSYTPPTAYTLKSVPTAFNSGTSGTTLIFHYGGVQINKLNNYLPMSAAQTLGQAVNSARPVPGSSDPQDVGGQVWTVSGNMKAVSASLGQEQQDGNVNPVETDLSFASPGDLSLDFTRFYQSSWTGNSNLGIGWRDLRYTLQFSSPSWFDETHIIKVGANPIATASNGDTRLRSGSIRVIDAASGGFIDFQSSAQLTYGVDSLGNATTSITGLNGSNVPTFTPGLHQTGATLTQNTSYNYVVTLPDASTLTFDANGNLLQTLDRHGKAQTYAYDAQGRLSTISDGQSTPQVITLAYDSSSGLLSTATGPNGTQSAYQYDSAGRLTTVLFKRSSSSTTQYVTSKYSYNSSTNQLIDITRLDGRKSIVTTADVKGRSSNRKDIRSNTVNFTYVKNTDGSRSTSAVDPASGLSAANKTTDTAGRMTSFTDSLGHTYNYSYTGNSMRANKIQLPTSGRPPIYVTRNAMGQPTKVVDMSLPSGSQAITETYDPANQIKQVVDQGGRMTQVDYTSSHRVYKFRRYHNGSSVETTLAYDANDNPQTVTDPVGKIWHLGYDNVGRIISQSDPTGVSTTYDYDSLGRLSHIHLPTTSVPVTFNYDDLDRVTSISTALGTNTYQYDPVTTWVTSVSNTGTDGQVETVAYTYNTTTGDTQTTKLTVPVSGGGTTSTTTNYTYDNYGNLQSVTPPGVQPINFNYNGAGQLLSTSETNSGPKVGPTITASAASSGVWTSQNNQTITVAPPTSSLPITGYNYAEDASTSLTSNLTANTVAWNTISDGKHTFNARAVDSSNLWSPESTFNLWVDTTPPAVTIVGVTPSPIPQGSVTVTLTASVADASSGLVGSPQLRWCVSSDSSRPWSSYTSMNAGTGSQWSTSFVEPGTASTLYYQIQTQDAAGNIGIFNGSMSITGPNGNDGPLMSPLALAFLALLFFGTGNWLLNRKTVNLNRLSETKTSH